MATTPPIRYDTGAEPHAPELYHPTAEARTLATLADIGPDEIAFYRDHGYLAVRQAFSPAEVATALSGLVALLMGEHPEFDGVWFEAAACEQLPQLDAEQRQDVVRKLADFVRFEPWLYALAHQPALLGTVARLLGDRRPELFQDMALIKPPSVGREKPWHQDAAYFNYPLGTPIVGVWIALDEATIDNGCMQILPGRHKDGPVVHFQRRDWQICDREILGRTSVAVPLPPGGLLFFDGLLPHGTPHNRSPKRRRAVQFHYAPDDVARGQDEERLAVFGAEGKNVSC